MTLTSGNEVKVRTRLTQFLCPIPHLPPEEWQVDVSDIPSLIAVQAGFVELDEDSPLDRLVRIPGFLVQNLQIVHNWSFSDRVSCLHLVSTEGRFTVLPVQGLLMF